MTNREIAERAARKIYAHQWPSSELLFKGWFSPKVADIIQAELPGWLPIELAPKEAWSLFFTPAQEEFGYLEFCAVGYLDRHGELTGAYQWEDGLEATHWMPLPASPSKEVEKNG